MRTFATVCFVLAGLMALGSLRDVGNPPEEPHDDAFWIGHYTAVIFGPLIPLSLGLGLRRTAKRRERLQPVLRTAPEPPRKWSALGASLTAVFLIGTAMAFPREGEDWTAINVVGVLIGTCLMLASAYMAVRPKGD